MDHYSDRFYMDILSGSRKSAEIVLPLVFSGIKPKSVVDIGCGSGAWLSIAKGNGVSDVLGLDGDYARGSLLIKPNEFKAVDISKGFLLGKRYDLALCLEVGEHIKISRAPTLVNSLTDASDVILFSAAIPGQGGQHHINKQWPDFWKRLFLNNGYVCFDCIRPKIYTNPEVEWWYRQNIFLYVNGNALKKFPCLKANPDQASDVFLLHKSLLRKRYGLVRSLLYYVKFPMAYLLDKIGFRIGGRQ